MCDIIAAQIENSKLFCEVIKSFIKYLLSGSIIFILIGIGIWLMATGKIVIGVGIVAIIVLVFILINSYKIYYSEYNGYEEAEDDI